MEEKKKKKIRRQLPGKTAAATSSGKRTAVAARENSGCREEQGGKQRRSGRNNGGDQRLWKSGTVAVTGGNGGCREPATANGGDQWLRNHGCDSPERQLKRNPSSDFKDTVKRHTEHKYIPVMGEGSSSLPRPSNKSKNRLKMRCKWCRDFFHEPTLPETFASSYDFTCPNCKEKAYLKLKNDLLKLTQNVDK